MSVLPKRCIISLESLYLMARRRYKYNSIIPARAESEHSFNWYLLRRAGHRLKLQNSIFHNKVFNSFQLVYPIIA